MAIDPGGILGGSWGDPGRILGDPGGILGGSWGDPGGNHQNVGWGNRFPRATLYDFLTRPVRTPQAQLGWGITTT